VTSSDLPRVKTLEISGSHYNLRSFEQKFKHIVV